MAFLKKELEVFVGGGFTLPLKLVNGRPPIESGFELIRSSIRMILAWTYGTRFFLNEFGSRNEELLEEPTDGILASLLEDLTRDALETWEKRIEVGNVTAEKSIVDRGLIEISIAYRVRATERTETYVYPFYYQIAS